MNEEFKKFLNGGYKGKLQVRNNFPEEYKIIEDYNKNFHIISWGQKLYNYVNNISHPPRCVCGNGVSFHKFGKGYKVYCSRSCMYKDENLKKKIRESWIEKYGVDNPLKSQEIQDKRRDLYIEKYYVEHHSQLPDIIEKKKQTNMEKYGVTTNLLHEDTIEKSKKTKLERYGVDHQSKSEVVKEKKRQTNLKNCGYEYNLQSPEFEEQSRETCLKKYGVDHTSKSKEIREKQLKTRRKNWLKKIANQIGTSVENIKYVDFEFTIKNYCHKHEEFKISQSLLHQRWFKYRKNICTKCNPINKHQSVGENEIRTFIQEKLKTRTTHKRLNSLEIDIYLPDYNLGIEYNGIYWHSSIFRYEEYHLKKTELCEENGIQLLHIFESDWIHRGEIVKSLIKSKLNIYDRKFDVIDCKIKEIEYDKTVEEFLENNHIQGYVRSTHNIGLFHDNELVSLMGFDKKGDGEYEILRFCDKLNTNVLDSRKRLINYIIKNNHPREITTSVDRRYFNGDIYKQLGFEIMSYSEPDYWYYEKNELICYHKSQFSKDILIEEGYDPDKTESEIMEERGYYKIYDCGTIDFNLAIPI